MLRIDNCVKISIAKGIVGFAWGYCSFRAVFLAIYHQQLLRSALRGEIYARPKISRGSKWIDDGCCALDASE